MCSYNQGVKDTLKAVERQLKETSILDPFVKSILDRMLIVSNEVHEDTKMLLYILRDNTEVQKILAWITSNYLTSGAIRNQEKLRDIAYRTNIEKKLRDEFYRDMASNEFKYFQIVIDVLHPEKIKEIALNKRPYIDKILNVNKMVEEIQSALVSREIGLCLMI